MPLCQVQRSRPWPNDVELLTRRQGFNKRRDAWSGEQQLQGMSRSAALQRNAQLSTALSLFLEPSASLVGLLHGMQFTGMKHNSAKLHWVQLASFHNECPPGRKSRMKMLPASLAWWACPL
jgi:hypothetical protein